MELDKKDVGNRLKVFAKEKFGGIKGLGDAIGLSQPNLSGTYINGRSLPGAELLVKLMAVGCNIQWLLTGEKNDIPNNDNSTTAIGNGNIQHSKVHIPQSKADIIRQLELDGEKEEVKLLRQENAEQKEEIKRLNAELLKCKDQIISILSKDRGQ